MKKLLYLAVVALVAFAACGKEDPKKDDDKGKEEQTQTQDPDAITLTSDAIVNVEAESSMVEIVFTTNAAWTAKASDKFIELNPASGEAGEAIKVKAVVQSLPEDTIGREGSVTITAGKATATVKIMQGVVFYFLPGDWLQLDVEGGKAEFSVVTNTEYSVTIYDSFAWAGCEFDEASGKGSFTVPANEGYDARSAYIKFTIPAIQDPVYDDEGNATGETSDHVEKVYVYQEGNASILWMNVPPASFDVTNSDEPVHDATASIAYFGGSLLVCDATAIYAMNSQGAYSKVELPDGLPCQSITNDDAGNLLIASLMPYGGVGKIYAVAANDTEMANPKVLIPFVNDAWSGSRGADKVAARGDVFGNGIVTMIYGGVASYGGLTYGFAWEITGGNAAVVDYNEWNKTTTLANGLLAMPALADDLWLSNRAAFVPAGTGKADGYFYSGYDGNYNVYFYNGTEWTVVLEEVGNWAYAPNGLATIEWNGKKILAIVDMAYFPEWSMSSYLIIADVTDLANPQVLSTMEYYNPLETYITGAQESSTTDVLLAVDGNDLVATVIDSAWGILMSTKYPKL